MGSRVWALAMATRSTERTVCGVCLGARLGVRLVWWLLVCDPSVGVRPFGLLGMGCVRCARVVWDGVIKHSSD